MPYRLDRAYGARLGVLRRDDPHGAVRWFDIEPCYVFHPSTPTTTARTITIDVVRYPELWATPGDMPTASLWRWTIDLGRRRGHRAPARRPALRVPSGRRPTHRPAGATGRG